MDKPKQDDKNQKDELKSPSMTDASGKLDFGAYPAMGDATSPDNTKDTKDGADRMRKKMSDQDNTTRD